ncbi:hypothetical protein B0A55_09818 [Friedmanniomyces simplex]|uniref:Uncharacterized protein n=1 Tax=Friedmanniomyces simplex TaxID=329884 RepID=A0A4U0WNM7_9PEZI|nr:hypothetical protein B0A55_09818 [Friedmanniomyces simplex]
MAGATSNTGYGRLSDKAQHDKSLPNSRGLLACVPNALARGFLQLSRVFSSKAYPRTTGAFHRFLDLPLELREIVYALYFDEAKIAVKGEPCTKHATSILSVSRQLHNEASAVMFRAAAFTVHLGWHHTRNHEYDLARCFGRLVQPETYFVGRKEVFTRFRNFNFHLDVQKRRHLQKYWQHIAAVFYAMKLVMLETRGTCCLTINVGDLGRSSKGYRVLHESAVWVDRSDLSWRRKIPFDEHALPVIDLPADTGQRWKALTPPWRL